LTDVSNVQKPRRLAIDDGRICPAPATNGGEPHELALAPT
jgi:hypothetical protein